MLLNVSAVEVRSKPIVKIYETANSRIHQTKKVYKSTLSTLVQIRHYHH